MYHKTTNIALINNSSVNIEHINKSSKLLLDDSSTDFIIFKNKEKKLLYKITIEKSGKELIVSSDYILKVKNYEEKKINISLNEYIDYIKNINTFVVLSTNTGEHINIKNNKEKYNIYKEIVEEDCEDDFIKLHDDCNELIDINDKLNNREYIYYMYKNYIRFNMLENFLESYLLEPYLFGYWYATYSFYNKVNYYNGIKILNNNQLNYFKNHIYKYNLYLEKQYQSSDMYYIKHQSIKDILNIFVFKYNLHNNYSIPNSYKYSSIDERLQILSGILDGSCKYISIDNNNYYIYDNKNNIYQNNICNLLDTLGIYYKYNNIQNKLYIYVKYQKEIGNILTFDNIVNISSFTIQKLNIDDCYNIKLKDNNKNILLDDLTII